MEVIYDYKQKKVVGYISPNYVIGAVSNSFEKKLTIIDAICPDFNISNYNAVSLWNADIENLTYSKTWVISEKTDIEKAEYIAEQQRIEDESNVKDETNIEKTEFEII